MLCILFLFLATYEDQVFSSQLKSEPSFVFVSFYSLLQVYQSLRENSMQPTEICMLTLVADIEINGTAYFLKLSCQLLRYDWGSFFNVAHQKCIFSFLCA